MGWLVTDRPEESQVIAIVESCRVRLGEPIFLVRKGGSPTPLMRWVILDTVAVELSVLFSLRRRCGRVASVFFAEISLRSAYHYCFGVVGVYFCAEVLHSMGIGFF